MNNYFVILAAGKSTRFDKKNLKQFYIYRNKEIIDYSVEKSLKSKLFKKVVIVTNNIKYLKKKNYNKSVKIIKGGVKRSDSSLKALKYLQKFKPNNVLIHDAARPNFTTKLVQNLIKNLRKNKAVVPVVYSKDSIKYKMRNKIFNLDKKNSLLTQTPQAFKFKDLFELSVQKKNKSEIDDESALFINNNYKIKFIPGEIQNTKITYLSDVNISKTYFGLGFDLHRLVKKQKLYLGGIKIPFHSGLKGHSDGDVILHAIIDSLLGAMRKSDIGTLFPSNSSKFKNIRSKNMLTPVLKLLNHNNFSINNIDINLICENPKVSRIRNKIIKSLSNLLSVNRNLINLKGKTVEKLGIIGKEQAIACEVICSLSK